MWLNFGVKNPCLLPNLASKNTSRFCHEHVDPFLAYGVSQLGELDGELFRPMELLRGH